MSQKNRKLIDSFTASDEKGKVYVIHIFSETSTSWLNALFGVEKKESVVLKTKRGHNVISHGGRSFSICKGMGKWINVKSDSKLASTVNLFNICPTGS